MKSEERQPARTHTAARGMGSGLGLGEASVVRTGSGALLRERALVLCLYIHREESGVGECARESAARESESLVAPAGVR